MKLSIITINRNNADGLRKTIESVVSQTFTDFEYIIIDGASTDDSVEVIKEYADRITYWVSEPDKGIFNAMNKACRKIDYKSNYSIFLNSGDMFSNEEILRIVCDNLEDVDLLYGNLLIIEKSKEWEKKYNQTIDFEFFLKDTLPHQASFIRSKYLISNETKIYSEDYKFISDWKLFIDLICKKNITFKYLDLIISAYDYNGYSSLPENFNELMKEKTQLLEKEYGFYYFKYIEMNNLVNDYSRHLHSLKSLTKSILDELKKRYVN